MGDRLKNLLNVFEQEGIKYVHWKSNLNIDKALSYDDDFDILVSPKYKRKILLILNEYNFIRDISKKDQWQNEIFHYYGIDLKYLKVIHFHLHFLLEIGHDYDKMCNLPIIEKYLDKRQKYKYTYLPEFEKEYILLIIRIILKNDLKAFLLKLPHAQIRTLLFSKKGVVKRETYREFLDLKYKIHREKLDIILNSDFNFIEKDFFNDLEQVVEGNKSIFNFFNSAIKLNKRLNMYNRHSIWFSFWLSFMRINVGRITLLSGKNDMFKKRNLTGGRIYAFIGGDGAGKSTNIEKLYLLFKEQFYVKKIHIGRPKKFFLGTTLRILSKGLSLIQLKDISLALSYLSIAHDRYRSFKIALKLKNKGCIVLLDRFPIKGIDKMDCPRIHQNFPNKFNYLSRLEKNYHEKINYYDKIFVLKLNPEIAIQRRPEDNANELRLRSEQVWEKNFSDYHNSIVINTEDSFKTVERKLLKEVWLDLHMKSTYEIVGLAATGKSTARSVLEGKNITFNPKIKKHIFLQIFLKYFVPSISILFKSRRLMYLTTFIYFKYYLDIIRKSKIKNLLFFDQGPIFMATILAIEIPKMKDIFFKELKEISPFFKNLIYLEAPKDILISRIENRTQEHRIKELNEKEKNIFLNTYINIYDEVLDIFVSNGVNIKKINTHRCNVNQVKEIIMNTIVNELNKKC